jgi:DNA-binding response OmpR family regulator
MGANEPDRPPGRILVPGVPALYMSGYAETILDSIGVPAPSIDILEKPFTEAALLARVHAALDAGRGRPAGGSAELAGDEGDGELQFRPVTG